MSDGGVLEEHKQRTVARLSQVGQSNGFISHSNICINVVQFIVSTGGTGDILVKSGKVRLHIPSNSENSFRVYG